MPGIVIDPKQRDALAKASMYLAGGSNGNNITQDVVIKRGRGSRVWDLSDNEYVDYALGSGPMLIGHAHPEVVEAVMEQVAQGTTFFGLNDQAIRLAEEIVQAVPCADKVRFVSSGTEATFYAMRAARAYRERDKILKFEGSFHGMSDYALMSMAPSRPLDFPQATHDTYGIPRSVQSGVLIAPFNDIDTTSAIIEKHHDELAGVIVEPLQRIISPKPGFLQALREVTRLYEIPLIFDEVVTGFRLAYGGAQEYYGVVPDLCALGKVVAGGFPLAAIAGSEEIMKHLTSFREQGENDVLQIGTLSGNPVASVAGLATLRVLKREGTYERLFATGQRLMEAYRRVLNEAEMPGQVVGVPPMFDVLFVEAEVNDYRSTVGHDKRKYAALNELLLARGIYKPDTKFYVSTVHDEQDVDVTVDTFASAIQDLGN